MVRGAARSLTKVGFRRDVKMFLALLVAFFVIVSSFLLILLQNNVERMREVLSASENLAADIATSEIRKIEGSFGEGEFDSVTLSLRARLPIDAIEVRINGRVRRSGDIGPGQETITRRIPGGTAKYYFDASPLDAMRRRFNLTAGVTVVAIVCGIALFFIYLPHILRPIEEMLEEAKSLGHAEPPADEATYLIQTFRDSIATLKLQEAELHRLNEIEKNRADELYTITSTLTRSLTSGFIALDPEGRVVEMNNAAREILDVHAGTMAPAASISTVFRDSTGAEIERLIADRQPILRREFEIHGDGGQTKIIGLTTVCLFTPADRFLGTLALFTDLSQVRRLESRVRELQSLADLGVMSTAIAHEFRNSLSTILGLLKLARRSNLTPEVDAKLETAERESHELAEAVTSLLQFARPMRLQFAEVDLRDLIDGIVDRLREINSATTFHIEGPHVRIGGDATLLSRAFENVIRNAIDATAEAQQPLIDIAIGNSPDPSVEIRDNGTGIAEEEVGSLFLPFHSTKPNGVGMGLPLARKIFLLHGGTITLTARPEGGATVRVELLDSATSAEQVGQQISA